MVAHFVPFLAKWTKAGKRWGGVKRARNRQPASKRQDCQAVFVEGGALCSRDYDREMWWQGEVSLTVSLLSFLHTRTTGTTFLTSEITCIVSGPSQLSSVSFRDRPIWDKISAEASLFCWPGVTKSRWDWDDAEWTRRRATRTIRTALNKHLLHDGLLSEPAMFVSVKRGPKGKQ